MKRFEYKATANVVTDTEPVSDDALAKVEAELNAMGLAGWELVQRHAASLDHNRIAVWDIWKREIV